MKIRFTLSLDASTVKAFKQVEDCEDGGLTAGYHFDNIYSWRRS